MASSGRGSAVEQVEQCRCRAQAPEAVGGGEQVAMGGFPSAGEAQRQCREEGRLGDADPRIGGDQAALRLGDDAARLVSAPTNVTH